MDSIKALDVKVSIKLAQMSSRIDELFGVLRNLQVSKVY